MYKEKKMVVDSKTGEIESEYMLVAMKRHNGFQGGWLAMSQNALKKMSNEIDRLEDFRVLMVLLSILDFDNYIMTRQSEIAESLGMDKSQVSRAIKRLVDKEILVKGPRIGRSWTYRLNPRYGWKGSAKGHHKALQEAAERWGDVEVV